MVAGSSSVGVAEKKPGKRSEQGSSRKGCMRGKGGPENAMCTYKGVRQRIWGKWVVEIRGARLRLGTFDNSYEAALAHDAANRKLYGSQAKLNLPDQQAPKYHRHQLNPHLQHQVFPSSANPGMPPLILHVDQPPRNYNSRRAETQLKQGGMKVEENMTSGVNNEGMDGIFWGEHEREFSGV
ncbi:hypothetical protein ACFX2I_040010 [Malus domestica]